MIGFDRPVYRVREDAGQAELTVQLFEPFIPEVDRPVIFTYVTEDGSATSTFTRNQHSQSCVAVSATHNESLFRLYWQMEMTISGAVAHK